ncbi:RagB/SusD family nutrient uptake outer membrane protein [Panacibacter ginsenosidivorans]|uniref:RagB/SusD family nutrient uptake outer membrane protein n=1 Tax=Panacibacter ginsenosidivorans TaxID=1813871 RepID=A0A5B8VBP0_9BACT|nr:RagB/SusD family nutrient uptake outer membrane protein [Panacibacter ginsenosidivorans]QEC68844.1 RagB/SusD family nutrient uptake outer membrane protein [Panacibacter ginsenosidivorans]
MKRILNLNIIVVLLFAAYLPSCKKDYGNLNSPTIEDYLKNASKDQLNGLVAGTLSGMRNNEGLYLDAVGVMGREMYRFSNADPRYTSELLGSAPVNNTGFYITNPWGSRYRVVKNCNVLIDAATNSTQIADDEKKGYLGFAKTIKAYDLLMNLNLTYTNGIRVDVSDPNNLGPILGYDESIAAIASLLDEAKTDLSGATVLFPLTDGFGSLSDAAGLTKFNRALAARVDVYRQQWANALTDLNASFFDLNGDFNTGVFEVFGTGTGDQLNTAFFPQEQNGEVRLAHPSYADEIEGGDDRINKATLRTTPVTKDGLTSDRDLWVYTSSVAPIPIIRNEELILIYAEASIQTDDFDNAITAINIIRNGHGLEDYSNSEPSKDDLINEMLNQRRYSLFYEGHRWVDMRRYNKLGELPLDRTGDQVWSALPIPQTEGE